MEPSYQTTFSKSLMTALFSGLVATVVCLVYNMVFRDITDFGLSTIINVSTVIFSINLLFLIIGFIYYAFLKAFKKGDMLFIIVFLLLTILCAWRANVINRSDIPLLNIQFHHLLVSLIIIMGLFAGIGIPVLFHSKKFEEHVL